MLSFASHFSQKGSLRFAVEFRYLEAVYLRGPVDRIRLDGLEDEYPRPAVGIGYYHYALCVQSGDTFAAIEPHFQ